MDLPDSCNTRTAASSPDVAYSIAMALVLDRAAFTPPDRLDLIPACFLEISAD